MTMSNSNGGMTCMMMCWVASAVIGLLAALFLYFVAGFGGLASVFMGVILFLILGFLLPLILCGEDESHVSHGAVAGGAATAAVAGAGSSGSVTSDDDDSARAAREAAEERAKQEAAEAARLKAEAEAEAKAQADAAAKAEAEAAARAEAEKTEALEKAKAVASVSSSAPASGGDADYDGDGVIEGANEGTRPEALDGPRGGVADDLKKVKGIGPKMEKLCNSLGFYHFDQIASWSADEVAWVDANLEGFKGRVTRDTWVEQAKLLASGAETEFSKKVDEGDVY